MPTVVIGIDPASTRLAGVVCRIGMDGRPRLLDASKRELTTKKWSPEVTPLAMEWSWDLLALARSAGDPVVYMEAPVVGRGGVRSTMVQAFTSGAVQAAFGWEEVPVHLVNVQTWKKELANGGPHPVGKDAVGAMVGEQWPEAAAAAAGDADLIDAAAIALYGCAVARRVARLERQGCL